MPRDGRVTVANHVVEPRWTWIDGRFRPNIRIEIGSDGRIVAAGPLDTAATHPLPHHAVIPGMVSAHSHAFQRGLRGHGERFPGGAGSFWSWREAMYDLVARVDPHQFGEVCRWTFEEMLDAGITTVGEFHYLHHGRGHADFAFDALVLEAAAAAGIRLVLLNTYYDTGGIGQPLGPAQQRFATHDLDAFWKHMDALAPQLHPTQSLGVAAHSIRAVGPEDVASLHGEATRRGWPFHMHVEEQRREIEECVAAYGARPLALLNDTMDIGGNLTAVHCTHSDPADLERLVAAGGAVCLCPLTEANLGDGVPEIAPVLAAGDALCLGTDSNARISAIEEMRLLEYGQRLVGETRGVVRDATGKVAARLLEIATKGGAAALGIDAGVIAAGRHADMVAVDLDDPSLRGCDGDTLADALVFGAGGGAVAGSWVGGRWRARGPAYDARRALSAAFTAGHSGARML